MMILRVEDLLQRLEIFSKKMPAEEFAELRVVLGDDDDLNGMHYGLFCDLITKGEDKDIDEVARYNVEDDKYILIS